MSRVFSFRDLRLIPALSEYNEIELLHPSMDEKMNHFLGQLGFDLDYAILYVPAKHRDMQGKVGVGFRAVGEISINRAFITSPLCSITERLIAASYTDPSLTRELCQLMGNSISFKGSEADDTLHEDWPEDLYEPDYEEVTQQIKTLEDLRDQIRGPMHNEYGSLKTPREYA